MVERGGRKELNKPTSFQSTNGTALNEDTITPLVSASLLLLLSNLKEYSRIFSLSQTCYHFERVYHKP